MSSAVDPSSVTGQATGVPPIGVRPPRSLSLPPAWPLIALLLFYPVWWLLGLGILIYPLLAIPMVFALVRRRQIHVPPGFLLWLLFLLVVVVSMLNLGYDPAGTVPGSAIDRLPGALLRLVEYASLTVLLLYAGNLTEAELPRRRLIGLLAWSFLITVAGGLLGVLWPTFEITAPIEHLLPTQLADNAFVRSLVHPAAAQIHQVLGYPTPRPAAPWGYTNIWGNNLLLLIGWFVLAGWSGSGWRRLGTVLVLGIAIVPIVLSLNRGLWLGLALAAVYVAVRLVPSGQLWPIAGLGVATAILAALLVATPLGSMVASRLEHGHSNNIRIYTIQRALEGVAESPVIGFGSTRNTLGSGTSIAVGASAACRNCGNHTIGSNGQFWLELYAHGWLGLGLFTAFFLVGIWRFRRDTSPEGLVGELVLLLNLLASFYYNTLITPLAFTFLSYAVLWRREAQA